MPVLEVEDLTVDYGGLRALEDVTLTVASGGCVGLIGPNGAGKTTLFDCVLGTVVPSRGDVRLFGRNVGGWPPHRRARLGMARTFQRLELFGSLTAVENVIVALESASSVGSLASQVLRRPSSIDVRTRAQSRALELLEMVGLGDAADSRAADLPMGSSRALEVARAIATEPRLLLLDEPSSGLNEAETAGLGELLERLRSEMDLSLLVVEHDMELVLGLSKEIYVLEFGRLIAHGTPARIRRSRAVKAAYLGEESPSARS
jgi:branched-chain amino acid transport system ATP-binding protein